jgi:hypothetical protein
MIYELKTYDLRPHSVEEVERRFSAAYETRRKISELAGSFHTEIGPLNQVVQIWPYKNQADRERVAAKVAVEAEWPPDIRDFVVRETTEVFTPFGFSPAPQPGHIGPYFELRRYTYSEGDRPRIERAWEAALPDRLEWSPLVFIATCEDGDNRWLAHIWAYHSLDQRAEVRRNIRATGSWPPHVLAKRNGWPPYTFVEQENRIMIPSPCSPLQ